MKASPFRSIKDAELHSQSMSNPLSDFTEISPSAACSVPSAAQISGGIPIPAVRLVQILSADEWEEFTEEWLTFHRNAGTYCSVRRYSGSGDKGLDVVAFTSPSGFAAPWDSYQCKHYDHALYPSDVYGEIGKLIYHSFLHTPPFDQNCLLPTRHVFVAPHGVGIKLGRLLRNPDRLKEDVRTNWLDYCEPALGAGVQAPLTGPLLQYFDAFDFSIFEDRTAVQLVEEHAQTPFHARRFGGGLPAREAPEVPPPEPTPAESVYLRKLLAAYSDHLKAPVLGTTALGPHYNLQRHYNRQRELFFNAEGLRNFARDRTPPRTFESLQDEVYFGVIDVCEASHSDALERVRKTVAAAGQLSVSGNALVGVTKVEDKQGICHQLANEDRLEWLL
jgi:hypothetical protein